MVRGLDEPQANRHIAWHVQVRQYLLGDPLEDRRGHLPALAPPHRRIQQHQNRHGRVIDRSEAGEGSNQLPRRISARRRIDFLRRPGFSGSGPAIKPS